MRLVVDTNVLVSAFLWQGTPGRLIELAAELEPQIVAEYRRRVPAGASQPAPGGSGRSSPFDAAFDAAVSDGIINQDELSMLAKLAVAVGMVGDENAAREVVIERARVRGVNVG